MKTFAEYCKGTNHVLGVEASISVYLNYALGEMEEQLHPMMSLEVNDEIYNRGYKAGKDMLRASECIIPSTEYTRLLKQDRKAKDAFDRGYSAGAKGATTARNTARNEGYNHGYAEWHSDIYKVEKAAHECAMTFAHEYKDSYKAIEKLREVLGISPNDVYNKKYPRGSRQ